MLEKAIMWPWPTLWSTRMRKGDLYKNLKMVGGILNDCTIP